MKKRWFAVAAAAGLAALTLGLSPVKAQVLGAVSFTGTDVTDFSTFSVTFGTPAQIVNATASGIFAQASGGPFPPTGTTDVGMNTTTRNMFDPTAWNGTQLFGSTQLDVNDISGFVGNLTTAVFPAASLTLSGNALLTIMGVGNFPGIWEITTQVQLIGGALSTTFSGTIEAVPGPIVGAGLPGLIAALGGLVAMARRRRNQLA